MLNPWYMESDVTPESAFMEQPATTLDFETTNRGFGDPLIPENRIVLACISAFGRQGLTVRPFEDVPPHGILVAHNAKFEMGWIQREGVDTTQALPWCSMIAEKVLAGNRPWPLDLGSVARRYGLPGKEPVIDSLMDGGVCPSEHPRHLLEARVRRDVETTAKIFLAQRAEMKRRGLLGVMFTRMILLPVLVEIEATGMTVDGKRVRTEVRRVRRAIGEVEGKLAGITGGINLRSTKQIAEFVYDKLGFTELCDRRGNTRRTASGKRLTDAGSLDSLVAATREQREFVKLRKEYGDLNARLTKTLDFLGAVVEQHQGRFHGTFHQARTQTHRLSSSGRKITVTLPDGSTAERGIQFQNLPVEYKKLFTVTEPNYRMVEVDGSQLEFRVAAYLGQDTQAASDIQSGHDVHRYTASVLHQIPESEVTKKQRNNAKPDTFKPLYGGQSGTPRQVAYYEAFRKRYSAIENAQKGWVHTVLREKELRTATGLTFYWPHCRMTSTGYVEGTASIYNYPIQSLATADIIPISLVHLYWRVKEAGLRVRFTNTVHDSVVMEVHEDDVSAVRDIAELSFLEDTYEFLARVYDIKFNVPLGLAITVGTHWGEGEEVKISRPNPAVMQLGG